ncbi:hypothetical protein R3P38DRAFT_2607754 [Favolaschia claudopus]|uniref:F-box domain-containing protein n=1 Tax=Favolaschia claudopus TaxID=2862362 RepID=A0AAW0D6V9_9AGAR
MPVELPQELTDAIIDHLSNDPHSLQSCSLVCRAFVFRCRFHLFATCRLTATNIFEFCCLLRSPACTFVPHVRSIHASRLQWHRDDRWFNEIAMDLRRLLGVRELDMTLRIVSTSNANAYFRTGFVTSFSSVTHLVLSCNFTSPAPLVDMICLFPALQDLHIRALSGTLADPIHVAVPPKELHDLTLSTNSVSPLLAWLYAYNHLPKVDALSLPPVRPNNATTLRTALKRLGGSLRHLNVSLTWYLGVSDVDPSTVFNLALHPNLETLAIRDYASRRGGVPQEVYKSHHMILLIMRLAAPALRHFELKLDDLLLYRTFDWSALDAFLSAEQRFPCLRSVVVPCRPVVDERLFLRDAMPLLQASGLLVLT